MTDVYDYSRCKASCKHPCDPRMSVETNLMVTEFPGPLFIDGVMERLAAIGLSEYSPSQMIIAEIFYTSLSQFVTEEIENVPISNLIGSIGGQLGKNTVFSELGGQSSYIFSYSR